ncbi:MAG: hypothetical protein ACE5FH_08535 [Candidatus Zixiibacteriota bacterium]
MNRSKTSTRSWALLLPLIALLYLSSSCGSYLKIESGDSPEERVESARDRADNMRAQWANQIKRADPTRVAHLVKGHIDSVSAMFVRYGRDVSDQWREAIHGRGEEVADEEMRLMVDRWTTDQRPILDAYDDNLEFGIAELRLRRFHDEPVFDILDQMVEVYDQTFSDVFYPAGTVEQYEDKFSRHSQDMEQLSARLTDLLAAY